jgi:hypothetical protein
MAKEFQKRWLDHAGLAFRADADVEDVPDQCEFIVKNTATLALQLLKRFRNISYTLYSGRIPPSVMLSYYAGLAASPNMSLSAMLARLAGWIVRDIEQASLYGRLLHVVNPVCAADIFTDRWPAPSSSRMSSQATCANSSVHSTRCARARCSPTQ